MKQLPLNCKIGTLGLAEVPVPTIKTDGILVKNYFSLVSAGTEKIMIEFEK